MLFGIDIDILVGWVIFMPMLIVAIVVIIGEVRSTLREQRKIQAETAHIDSLIERWFTYDEHLTEHSPLRPESSCAHCYLAMLERQR